MATRATVRELRGFIGALVGLGAMLGCAEAARGQAFYEVVHAFTLPGSAPASALVQAGDGTFYGTTDKGGPADRGTVFRMDAAGTVTTLHGFACDDTDGCGPGTIMQASDGYFYGTTRAGGAGNGGTAFKMDAAGSVTTLHSFDCASEGCAPAQTLIQASDGNFYGTTRTGGAGNGGTVFKMDAAGTLTILHAFDCASEGCKPVAGLVQARDGDFYGTTSSGGTVFKMNAAGALTTLHVFACNTTEGCSPNTRLVQASDGNFYGATVGGGQDGVGTIFKMDGAGAVTTLASFRLHCWFLCNATADGLIEASDGNLYGTTSSGGSVNFNFGTVYRVTPANGGVGIVHSFTIQRPEGHTPRGGLVQASDGYLYGTTAGGNGSASGGAVFKMTTAGDLTALHGFGSDTGGYSPAVFGGVIQARDGNFYGTTDSGGSAGFGTVFKMDAAGTVTTLHSFDCAADGCVPGVGLLQASDGNFYGTTLVGGPTGSEGTVFKMDPAGTFTVLHAFAPSRDGNAPVSALIQGRDGNFYGTTSQGGSGNGGTVFRMDAAGGFTTLHSFACRTDGCSPRGLIEASDGNFYGAAQGDGPGGGGTIFRLDAAGTFTVLHSFADSPPGPGCPGITEGCYPAGRLVEAGDGNFYGTTRAGGEANGGTVFRMDATGAVTPLHSFACSTDGCEPVSGLTEAGDGNLYGATWGKAVEEPDGVTIKGGTIFKVDAAGAFTPVHTFDCRSDGCKPGSGGLIVAADGSLYGTTSYGGPAGGGVVFRLATISPLPPPALTALSPAKLWIGLTSSNNVGLALDLLAEVFVDRTKIGEGRLDDVSVGGRGFDGAILYTIPLALLNGPVDVPDSARLAVTVSVRRSCSGGPGHNSGSVRLWYNGPLMNGGAGADAGSRFGATIRGASADYFLRDPFALSTEPGGARESDDVMVHGKGSCPDRAYTPFGTWSQ